MSERLVHLITCPEQRCNQCQVDNPTACNSIASSRDRYPHAKIILVEHTKGIAHFEMDERILPLGPPWYTNGWKSVYFGSDIDIFETGSILDVYFVGAYVSIIRKDEGRISHSYFPNVSTSLESNLLKRLTDKFSQSDIVQINTRVGLSNRLSEVAKLVSTEIASSIPEIGSSTTTKISQIVAQQATVFGVFIPLIMDDEVEEIFLDRPESFLYFDHRRFGRCYSSSIVKDAEVSKIVTLLRSESNQHLDRRNPSLKADLLLLDVPLRFSASIPPLTPDGFHMQIRRAKQIPFSISNLISNETLSIETAAILILAINSRMNITITGGPGVGKTTLLNALDMTTPQKWRKLYIEDAIESRRYERQHQIRIKVSPVDEMLTHFDKATEIVKSLHRSPDYLILGEIQTSDHSSALFQALSAGLRSIQTCHSDSASGLLTRWKTNHGITSSNLALMDVIVTLKRPVPGESLRRVQEIVEIQRSTRNGVTDFVGFNKLFDDQDSKLDVVFSQDGAFHLNALNAGSRKPISAFSEIVKILKDWTKDQNTNTICEIGELLWSIGHPMRFTSNS